MLSILYHDQQAARRIALTGCLTPAQVAAHNAFIEAMREESEDDRQAFVSTPSRLVGVQSGLPDYTTR